MVAVRGLALAALVALVACTPTGSPPGQAEVTTSPTTSAAPASTSQSPDSLEGTWRTPVMDRDTIVAHLSERGFSQGDIDVFLGNGSIDESLELALRIEAGNVGILMAIDGAPPEVATAGTYELEPPAGLVWTETGLDCQANVQYALDGDSLTFQDLVVSGADCENVNSETHLTMFFLAEEYARQ
jgi:hypothetical protein